MKYLVVYYSRTGNNRFIAQQLAKDIQADLIQITPRFNALFATLFNISPGNKKLEKDVAQYDGVILCGPVWMGKLIAPLKDFILAHRNRYKKLYFVTCCGSGEAEKDGPFGYEKVFDKVRQLAGDALIACHPLSLGDISADSQGGSTEEILNIRLNQDTFGGKIKEAYEGFVKTLNI